MENGIVAKTGYNQLLFRLNKIKIYEKFSRLYY